MQAEAKNVTWYNEHVMEARMAWRRRTLKEACSRYGLDVPGNDSLHRPNAWEFLINKQHHLIWCNIFKAASSSWMYNFNILAGIKGPPGGDVQYRSLPHHNRQMFIFGLDLKSKHFCLVLGILNLRPMTT